MLSIKVWLRRPQCVAGSLQDEYAKYQGMTPVCLAYETSMQYQGVAPQCVAVVQDEYAKYQGMA